MSFTSKVDNEYNDLVDLMVERLQGDEYDKDDDLMDAIYDEVANQLSWYENQAIMVAHGILRYTNISDGSLNIAELEEYLRQDVCDKLTKVEA